MEHPALKAWLDETEGFGLRRERLPDDALPWVAAAFQRGQETARAACIAVAANYIAAARAHCKPGKADAQIGAAEEIIELLSARAD